MIVMLAYITKNGSEYLTKKDIYDNSGMLLLSKGQKITKEIRTKLEKMGNIDLERINDVEIKQTATPLSIAAEEFAQKTNIRDELVFAKAQSILNTLIFESKTEPWWIFVNALSKYIDWMYTHSIDVSLISLMMAIELGDNEEELFSIGLGALLHDVGKLVIPKSIIQKPEKLTDMEMSYIKQHCDLGVSSIEGFIISKECIDIIMQHHERLDGSGYPKGIKGDKICRNAKIVMIADSVDAITSFRPYKKPGSMKTAIEKLRNEEKKYSQELISLLERILG